MKFKVEIMHLLCGFCNYVGQGNGDLVNHTKRHHRHHPNFKVSCSYPMCNFTSKSWCSFKVHMSKKHSERKIQMNVPVEGERDHDHGNETENYATPASRNEISNAVLSLLLKVESKYRVSQVALNEVVLGMREIVECMKTEEQREAADQILCQMSTQSKRGNLYRRMWSYIEPERMFLGKEYKTINGRPRKTNMYGYYIPIEKVLQAIMHSTDVLNWIDNSHYSQDGIMRDFCDGSFIRNSEYFQRNPQALQIILFYDDAEFCNPIGHRTRKHSMGLFYWTLGNFPPSCRSSYSSIFLLAVARTKHLKKWGLGNLLMNFIRTMETLDSGLTVKINGVEKFIQGRIIAAPCDSLGSASLGGFKMPGAFSKKPCRTCQVSSSEMQSLVEVSKIKIRTSGESQHFEKIANDDSLSPANKSYWSKWLGINSNSPLMQLKYVNLQQLLVHDPMHVLLEGVVQMNLLLLLKHAIQNKILTLSWLNTQLQSFRYSYLDKLNKPQLFDTKNVMKLSKIKQNAGTMLMLCYVLPIILKTKGKKMGNHYNLFMTLMRIVTIAFSPTATVDTCGELEVLVGHYLSHFNKVYPNKMKTPKMHFCLHFINQLEMGPLKYASVIRMEAKHNFWKQNSWKNFRNMPLSIAVKHQKNLCFELGDSQNSTFLSRVDEMKEEGKFVFDDAYPNLRHEFRANVLIRYNLNQYSGLMFSRLKELVVEGLKYKPGCALLMGWEDNWPLFGEVSAIGIFGESKFFIVNLYETEVYDPDANAYSVTKSNTQKLETYNRLKNKWPMPVYIRNGETLITNRVGHFGSAYV